MSARSALSQKLWKTFRAEGAISTRAWGTAPGIQVQISQALKARLISVVNRAFSTWFGYDSHSWGVAPGLSERNAVGVKSFPKSDDNACPYNNSAICTAFNAAPLSN